MCRAALCKKNFQLKITENAPRDGRYDDIKIKELTLGQTGGMAGPETCKKLPFLKALKNEKSKKSLQNWMESQGGCTRILPNRFFGHRWAPFGGFAPLKKNHLYSQKAT